MRTSRRTILFILFTISGFTGLIYESIWTHYLKLFLGHAAYAQTLVLAIFMGGLTLGSWLCSRYSGRWANLLKGYALAEGVIGLFAVAFHPVFTQVVRLSYDAIIPALNAPVAITGYKWTVSALLILPQTILLGMTFPLMSAAVLRAFPDTPGRSIAMLYFTNSIGAAVGVLASAFVLIRLAGLPGTIVLAGTLNVLLAIVVWRLAGRIGPRPADGVAERAAGVTAAAPHRLLLFVSLATGTASFIYEIGWIRMLSLVLGSSTHAFELMLSAFIFGLAFGGLWVQRQIDRTASALRYLAAVQVIMGLMAVATLPIYGQSFGVMQWLITVLPKTNGGYALFNLSGHAIALAVMLPATFCAGMTLPLITYALIVAGHGERSIGAVYAMNTIGAIIGVFFAVHVGMPVLGLKNLIVAGASLDMTLGLVLLWRRRAALSGLRPAIVATVVCLCAGGATLAYVRLDPYKMASGVYRAGYILNEQASSLLFHKDGKTATVSVNLQTNGTMIIRTNGKADAGINVQPGARASADEATMVLAALLPIAYRPSAGTAANIGFGSGLTTHALLSDPRLERVDTVEIETEMVEAARAFGSHVARAYLDPRSRIHIDDAKTFFSANTRTYDIIVSEPSNPWVSGVAGLFSDEFYRLLRRYLNEDGIFVQWIQLYEIDLDLVASVIKAIDRNFPDFVAYSTNFGDLLIVARKSGDLPRLDPAIFDLPDLAAELSRVDVRNIQDLEARQVAGRRMLLTVADTYAIRANSDYYPVLDQNAARARFLRASAQDILKLGAADLPIVDMLAAQRHSDGATGVTYSANHQKARALSVAMSLRDYFLTGEFVSHGLDVPADVKAGAQELKRSLSSCGDGADVERLGWLFDTARNMVPCLTPSENAVFWRTLESSPCGAALSPAEKRYVSLFKAIGGRDGASMSAAALEILDGEHDITPLRMKYVVEAGLLGFAAGGRRDEAARFWARYREAVVGTSEPDFILRFLVAASASSR